MVELFEAIRAGKITEIKLISTIEIENRKTIQFTGMNFFLVTLFSDDFGSGMFGWSIFFSNFFVNR